MLKRSIASLTALVALAGCSSSNGGAASDAGMEASVTEDSGAGDSAAPLPVEDAGGASFGFPVSNLPGAPAAADGGALVDLDITQSCSIDSVTGAFSGCGAAGSGAIFAKMSTTAGSLGVLYVHDFTVESGATLKVSGTLPLVVVASDKASIFGEISVAAAGGQSVAGGGQAEGTGVGGGAGAGTYVSGMGPGGGSFCGAGGVGGSGAVDGGADGGGAAGVAYGTANLVPLVGGSSGAGFASANNSIGGGGGGALQISAKNAISVSGSIAAGGGGGEVNASTSGGSGGAILLEAATVTVTGTLAANGGGGGPGGSDATSNAAPAAGGSGTSSVGTSTGGSGAAASTLAGGAGAFNGGGGGGAGRIRINTSAGVATTTGATISPSLGSACATEGTLGG